jgi:hypothetical protein
MKEETRQYLSSEPNRLRRAQQFLEQTEEPAGDLGEILFDARIDSAEQLDPSNRPQSLWLVRISGSQIRNGWLDTEMQNSIVAPLGREVSAATPGDGREEARIGLVGVSSGSVILHFRPSSPSREPSGIQLNYPVSPADAAIQKVSELHDLLENQAPPEEIGARFGKQQSLLKQAKVLIAGLSASGVDLSTRWWASDSSRMVSKLSQSGQEYGKHIFETQLVDDDEVVQGMVTSLDIEGFVTVTGSIGSNRKRKVNVGAEAIRSTRFALGTNVYLLAKKVIEVDSVGLTPHKPVYTFIRHLDDDTLFT